VAAARGCDLSSRQDGPEGLHESRPSGLQKRQHIIGPVFAQSKDARAAKRFMRRGKAFAATPFGSDRLGGRTACSSQDPAIPARCLPIGPTAPLPFSQPNGLAP
jgi:hypothetical protein